MNISHRNRYVYLIYIYIYIHAVYLSILHIYTVDIFNSYGSVGNLALDLAARKSLGF